MRCVIFGAGGHGRVVLDILLQAGQHEVVGFLDSSIEFCGRRVDGFPVLGDLSHVPELRQRQGVEAAVVAVGDNGIRRDLARRVRNQGLTLVNALHPSANLARTVTLGTNVVVAAGAVICAHAQVGDSAILNTGCIVDHETKIGTAVHICPGVKLAGHVVVDAGAHVGIGSTVIQNVRIGSEAIVGAGAVVIHNVEPHVTVVGVPARPLPPRCRLPASRMRSSAPLRRPPKVGALNFFVE